MPAVSAGLTFFRWLRKRASVAAPVGDGEVELLLGLLDGLEDPVLVVVAIGTQVHRLRIGLTRFGVEDELGDAARIADTDRLLHRHVVGDTVLGLTGREALEEGGTAVGERVEDRLVELGRVRHRHLRDERRAVAAAVNDLGNTLFFSLSLPWLAAPELVHVAATGASASNPSSGRRCSSTPGCRASAP